MKARSSSPVHVHLDEAIPVHVHVQRSQSLPSAPEKSHIVKYASMSNLEKDLRKQKEKKRTRKTVCRSHSSELKKSSQKPQITPKQAEKICSVIHSSDVDFQKDLDVPAKQTDRLFEEAHKSRKDVTERRRHCVFEDTSKELPWSCSSSTGVRAAGLTEYSDELENAAKNGNGSRLQTSSLPRLSELDVSRDDDGAVVDQRLLLRTLTEAESAASSAAAQLLSLKDTLPDFSSVSRFSSPDELRMSRQKSLLMEKLENFKGVNKSLRQQLQEMQDQEAIQLQADRRVEVLLTKLTEAEAENLNLRRHLRENERRIEELLDLRKKERENTETVVQLSKSVEATRAHLQGQLRHKEAENNRMVVQLRSLERTVTEHKLAIENLKRQMSAALDKAAQEKQALKKATRAQKHRAQRFEAAIEKCYSQLKDKDVKLTEALSAADTWKRHHEMAREEKAPLEAKIAVLQLQITDLTEQLKTGKDKARISNEDLLQKVEKLHSDNADLNLENARLMAFIADLEEKLSVSQAEVQEQVSVSHQQKDLLEQYKTQVKELQKEADELKTRCEKVLIENKRVKEGKDTDVEKVKKQLESRVKELEVYPDLLKAAEQRLQDCQDKLLRCERRCSDKSDSVSQLQVKVDQQAEELRSSLEVKDSLQEDNLQLQLRLAALQSKIEELESGNQELVHRLASQEEALQYSGKQLEERSAESLSLSRQLEAALADVKQQVSEVKDKALARESVLQSKILELETEKSRKDKELKQLRQSKLSAEKQYEIRLKDLQLSLDQSESHKQSIQNYVDFLKNSYAAMFGEGISSNFGASSF
uniref:Outer dense fiber of sperm tails 2 like n=1 Tax=Lepisosteus oculatus TaxID=7918 RepID=W5MDA8_LEPOC|nr:PREDICTED: outer dense fiber protein 2-like isoform X1 [Lepisosteus oculatus]